MDIPFLIVGLGNPGAQYASHRHNIGFQVVDRLHGVYRGGPWKSKFKGEWAEASISGTKALLLKPMTYMNLSGESVGEMARFFKIPVEKVIVLHDELDILPGKVRIKQGGGHGGHNGLKSVDQHLGQNYWRVRVGIGHPGRPEMVSGYVLSPPSRADEDATAPLLDVLVELFPLLLKGDASGLMNRIAVRLAPPKP